MEFSTGRPKRPSTKDTPLHMFVGNHKGHEGVELSAHAGNWDHDTELVAIDSNGVVWTGECLSIKLGRFNKHGKFIWCVKG